MTIIVGDELDAARFFSVGNPPVRGSSFDLTIGTIFDHDGKEINGPFKLEPGYMVQVASSEVFNLPNTVTGHVTYKTELTRNGIWALTVGIVDPGWNGPIATTLLNFSRVDYPIAIGEPFLRVTLFEHAAVQNTRLTRCPPVSKYLLGIRKIAMTQFPQTFMNQDDIAKKAGNSVLERIRKEALVWVALIAIIFTLIQLVSNALRSSDQIAASEPLRKQVQNLESRLHDYEATRLPPAVSIAVPSAPKTGP